MRGGGLCGSCELRAGSGFAFTRDDYTVDGLLRLAYARWKQNWLLLAGWFGIGLGLIYLLSFGGDLAFMTLSSRRGADSGLASPLHPAQLAFHALVSVLALALNLLWFGVCFDVLSGRRPEVAHSLGHLRALPHALLQMFVIYTLLALDFGLHFGVFAALRGSLGELTAVLIAAGTWLVLSPLRVYVGLGLVFAQAVLVIEPRETALSALRVSWRVVSGRRFETLGITLLSALIGMLGALACCVGVFVSLPLGLLLYCGLYLALRNPGSPRSEPLQVAGGGQ